MLTSYEKLGIYPKHFLRFMQKFHMELHIGVRALGQLGKTGSDQLEKFALFAWHVAEIG